MDPGGGAGAAASAVQASPGNKRKRNNGPVMPVITPTRVPARKLAMPAGSGRAKIAMGPENSVEGAGWVPAGPLNPENGGLRFSNTRRTTRIDPEGRMVSLHHPVTGEKIHHVTRTRGPANISRIPFMSQLGPRRKAAIVSVMVADAAQKGNTITNMVAGINYAPLEELLAERAFASLTPAQREHVREKISEEVINKLVEHYHNLNENDSNNGETGAAGSARRRRNRKTRRGRKSRKN